VLDKWTYSNYALGDVNEIKYVITAFLMEEKSAESHVLSSLVEQQASMKKDLSSLQELIIEQMRDIKQQQEEQAKENFNL